MGEKSRVRLDLFDNRINIDRGASRIKEVVWYVVKRMFFLTSIPFPSLMKRSLLLLFGAKVGQGIVIKPRVNIHMPWKLSLGNNVWIGEEVSMLNFEWLIIGSNCCISQRAFLCGGNHHYRDPCFSYKNGPITIEDGVWIGANCFVGPNVTIGTDSVITVGSYATKSLPSNGIYRGNPAVFLKHRWGGDLLARKKVISRELEVDLSE